MNHNRFWPDVEDARRALMEGDGSGVKIAVMDSGIAINHPALNGLNLEDDVKVEAAGSKLLVEDARAEDVNGHGTAIAYLIRQIAPKARLGNFRVLNSEIGSSRQRIAAGIREALKRGYQILNCSFGHKDEIGSAMMSYKAWVDEAYLAHAHVVSACNNDDSEIQEWPGFFPTCINVNMARSPHERYYYKPKTLVEFAAPGVDVRVPTLDGKFKELKGSSFAAPFVSAWLARLLGAFPWLNVLQAKSLLQYLAEPWTPDLAADNNFLPADEVLRRYNQAAASP